MLSLTGHSQPSWHVIESAAGSWGRYIPLQRKNNMIIFRGSESFNVNILSKYYWVISSTILIKLIVLNSFLHITGCKSIINNSFPNWSQVLRPCIGLCGVFGCEVSWCKVGLWWGKDCLFFSCFFTFLHWVIATTWNWLTLPSKIMKIMESQPRLQYN